MFQGAIQLSIRGKTIIDIIDNSYHYFSSTRSRKMRKVVKLNLSGRLYTFHISHFASILPMFLRNTPRNTKHSLYTFHILWELRVLLMPRKNKPQNPLTFRTTLVWNAKNEKRGKKREKPHNTFFIFRNRFCLFCDKCIASFRFYTKMQERSNTWLGVGRHLNGLVLFICFCLNRCELWTDLILLEFSYEGAWKSGREWCTVKI